MGVLRLLLALSVAYGHAGLTSATGFPLIPSDTAVQVFYGISGFYMALVLNQVYRPDNSTYRLFIGNRFARLFPTYVITLVASLVLGGVVAILHRQQLPFVAYWQALSQPPVLLVISLLVSQIFFVGMDAFVFLGFSDGSLSLATNFYSPDALAGALVVPPAWTLGVEFSFYLVAPFLVRRSANTIAIVVFASIALRLLLQFAFGRYNDPWSYRFFPSELAVFLVGALGYKVYRSIEGVRDQRLIALFSFACFCVAAAVLVNRWHGLSRVASAGLLLVFLLAIPFLFQKFRANRLDRTIGELSYPIYICHLWIIWALAYLWQMPEGLFRGTLTLVITILVSIMLYLFVERPIDAWRHKKLGPATSKR
jgi:peptidoglycan/LPS O-acetylase OafA/YrhL